jgi:hypothetical protein
MLGAIRQHDILFHPLTTVRCFGWLTFFRAATAGRNQTFLAILGQGHTFAACDREAGEFLDRSIGLELQARRLYVALARRFAEQPAAAHFFAILAQQEQDHADLLRLSAAAAHRCGWSLGCFSPWRKYLPSLEKELQEAESSLDSIASLDDALRLTIRIEASEINQVFRAILAGANSTFVKRLRPFRQAAEEHISYIVTNISQLSPNLTTLSRDLRTGFSPRV